MAGHNHRGPDRLLKGALLTFEQVAAIMTARGFPMTKQNVVKLEAKALRKLKERLESRGVTEEELWKYREPTAKRKSSYWLKDDESLGGREPF